MGHFFIFSQSINSFAVGIIELDCPYTNGSCGLVVRLKLICVDLINGMLSRENSFPTIADSYESCDDNGCVYTHLHGQYYV